VDRRSRIHGGCWRGLRVGGAGVLLIVALLAVQAQAQAQAQGSSVALSGRMGDKALLVINGKLRSLAVGAQAEGVRLLGLDTGSALVEVGGQRLRLEIGATPVSLGSGAPAPGAGNRIVLPIGTGGHFTSAGSINGRPVMFMVDTGASLVAISQQEAQRIGLRFQDAPRGIVQTANGQVPAHRVRLSSIRIGDVQVYEVDAVVMPASMGMVLLGNSFLNRFDLKRDTSTMTLDKRP
jgi:aspartyl protease family protein